MEIKQIPWSIPSFGEEEQEAIQRVVDSGWLTMGKETEEFEKELASTTKHKYNIVFNSGTSALIGALLAIGAYHKGYSARIPFYTYKATENAAYASGLKDLKYGDINIETGLMEPKESNRRYEIQIPVHFAGLPINQELWGETPCVVEDAAESFGATTSYTGNVRDDRLICYSFHAAKTITMIEGGCVSTDNTQLAYRLKIVRSQGEDPRHKGNFITRGLNLKPLDICSAVGRAQLKKLKYYLCNRYLISTIYRDQLEDYVEFQHTPEYVKRHGNMMFPIYVDKPMALAEHLKKNKIGTRLGWKPLKHNDNAQWIYEHIICIPIYNTMKPGEALYVSDKIKEFYK